MTRRAAGEGGGIPVHHEPQDRPRFGSMCTPRIPPPVSPLPALAAEGGKGWTESNYGAGILYELAEEACSPASGIWGS